MSLEQIVRPFQLTGATQAVRVEQAGQRQAQRVLLQFGRNGSGKSLTGSQSWNISYYCVRYVVEKKTA